MRSKFLILLVMSALLCGCEHTLTSKVWHHTREESFAPSPELKLQLFEKTNPPADVLVVYQELNDADNAERPRAFFLRANETRLLERRKPVFVDPNLAAKLQPIPVRPATEMEAFSGITNTVAAKRQDNNSQPLPGPLWARISPDGQSFTLVTNGKETPEYPLPVYAGRRNTVKRALLLPPALLGDITVYGAALGLSAGLQYLYAGGSYRP